MIFRGFNNLDEISNLLITGKVGILPTDTIYGFSSSALNKESVEKIYEIKTRDYDKPFIVLIKSINDINEFGIKLTNKQRSILESIWPGKVSVAIDSNSEIFSYLKGKYNSISFRFPGCPELISLLNKTGPLVSTSVNLSGHNALNNIDEINKNFSGKVDFIVDVGDRRSVPSTLIKLGNKIQVLRQGEYVLPRWMIELTLDG